MIHQFIHRRRAAGRVSEQADAATGGCRRVLMLAPHYQEYSYLLGRALAETATVELATDLARLDADYKGRVRPPADGLTLRNVTLASPFDIARVMRWVARFRPSVLHLQEPSGLRKAAVCAAIVTLVRPFCEIALTVHDPEPHDGRDARIAARLSGLRRYIRRAASVTFVHGESCLRQYRGLPESRDRTVVPTVHGTILSDAPPVDHGDRSPVRLLFFGRMEAYKGLSVLTDALQRLQRDGVSPEIHIAGRGPELDRMRDRLSGMANVRIDDGFIPSDRLIRAMREADCIVLPYLEATQSGVLAAAFGNGLFAIASRVGGLPDLVEDGENGLLVPPGDPDALASAIRRIADDPGLRARLRHGASATAATRLRWSRIAADVLKHYA